MGMSENSIEGKIKNLLDNELDYNKILKYYPDDIKTGAISLFQRLFIEYLNFEVVSGTFGGFAESVQVDEWNERAGVKDAYIIAKKDNFRIVYITLEKLTRTAQRYAISSLTSKEWAIKGEFLAMFHAPHSKVWHLVSTHITEGSLILRRFVVGEGEQHRTVSENLAKMDAELSMPLFERVEDAFRLETVTNEFYNEYKDVFGKIKEHLLSEGVGIRYAKKFSHLLLNRLMFIYFIQKKGWINDNKNFIQWYLDKYKDLNDREGFHKKWLNKLFFSAMSKPPSEKNINTGFPEEVCRVLNNIPFLNGGLFERDDVDTYDIKLPDKLMFEIVEGFLEKYNFTVTEESPYDVDVAIDPAMLGRIYESLIAEEERGKAGIFYTPKIEVNLMCRLALFEFLSTKSKDPDDTYKRKIIDFLFTPDRDWQDSEHDNFRKLMDALQSVKVVDPACGSGAFLVGMMQVLKELYRKLDIEPDYALKNDIIHKNLYGVDIKDWAVRMAEFRLWLAIIEEEVDIPKKEPVLPNFTFKLKSDDSIVQKIGDKFIRREDIKAELCGEIKDELKNLEDLKEKYFKGDKNVLEDINNTQLAILEKYIDREIQGLKDEINRGQQVDLSGGITLDTKEKLEEINKKIRSLTDTKELFREAGEQKKFIWDLDFPEIMLNGGFDIVIANPPYIRQEKIIDQKLDSEELENYPAEKLKKLKKEYKDDLVEYVEITYGVKPTTKCDYYVYFFYNALDLLNSKGAMVYISSNSWLDVDFGRYPQELFLKRANLDYVIDNHARRSFEEASINTVINVMTKKFDSNALSNRVNFIAYKKPFEDVNNPQTIKDSLLNHNNAVKHVKTSEETLDISTQESFRTVSLPSRSLWKLGGGEIGEAQTELNKELSEKISGASGNYSGDKWGGKYLRAPDIYFTIMEKGKDKLVKLGDIAEVRRGFTTGVNEFFYLDKKKINEWNIEEEFLKPVIKSPRECKSIIVNPKDLKYKVFMCHKSKDELKGTNALKYIEWGEKQKTKDGVLWCNVPSVQGRKMWYDLGYQKQQNIILLRFRDRRLWTPLIRDAVMVGDTVFVGIYSDNVDTIFMDGYLNTTTFILIAEIHGRINLGDGLLTTYGPDLLTLPIFNINLGKKKRETFKDLFQKMLFRNVRSIFLELGIDPSSPIRSQEPNPLPDRKELDDIIFDEIGLTEEERKEVYWSVCELVKNRLDKAKSV
jgi:hypothetical protein